MKFNRHVDQHTYFWLHYIAFLTSALVVDGAASEGVSKTAFASAIKDANTAWVGFARQGNVQGLASLYTLDAVIFPAGEEPQSQRPNIERYYSGFINPKKPLETSFTSQSLLISGDLAVEIGQYTNTTDGKQLQSYVVWKAIREGNDWVARFHLDAWHSINSAAKGAFTESRRNGFLPTDLLLKSANANSHAVQLIRPELIQHPNRSRPQLPDKWTATALMAPFTADQLVIGRFECDHIKNVARGQLFGTEYGSLEIVLTAEGAYRVLPSGTFVAFGPSEWMPWPRDWLGPEKPAFAGFAELFHGSFLSEFMEWWKTTVPGTEAVKWIWFAGKERIPRRTMFAREIPELPIIGSFATTYFLEFKAAPGLDLQVPDQIREENRSAVDLLEALRKSQSVSAEASRRLALLTHAAGMRFEFDSEPALPIWPQQFGMTTFMTPVRANINPRPTEVWYDYANDRQRTRMYHPSESSIAYEDALLLGTTGYHVQYSRDKDVPPRSSNVLPGIPRPGWAPDDRAKVKAIISSLSDGRRASSENENVIVIQAPMVDPRIFWTWYTQRGRPLMFLETSAPADVGTGLALADYYDWQPGATTADSTYTLPRDAKTERSHFEGGFMHSSFSRQVNFTESQVASLNPKSCYHCHRGPN